MDFYDQVLEACNLPAFVDKKATFRTLFAEWEAKNPVVQEVIQGKTTFEDLVTPVVEENLRIRFLCYNRGYCSSAEFKESVKKLKGVLSLSEYRRGFSIISLEEAPNFFWAFLVIGFSIVLESLVLPFFFIGFHEVKISDFFVPAVLGGLFGFFCLLLGFHSEITYFRFRRDVAREVLEKAKFLDKVVQEVLREV